MKFKNKLIALALAAALIPAFAHAETKIGVVDIQKIMRESLAAKDLQEQLEKRKNEFQSEVTKQEQQLQKEDKSLAEERGVLSADAFEKKRNAFKTKVDDTQRKINSRKVKLETGYANAINQIQNKVLGIVESIAKEKSLNLVMPFSETLYADSAMNISEEVLKKLDKELPKISLSVPEKEDKKEDKKEEKKEEKKKEDKKQ